MYSAFWLWALAQVPLLPNWIAGPAGLVGFGTLFFLRVGREEALMAETFGDEYRRYMARSVVYLFGTEDTDPNHSALDKSCAARAQGAHPLERGRGYLRHERSLAAARGIEDAHRSFEVVGVGHDQAAMFGSVCAAPAVFGVTNAKSGAQCIETTAIRSQTESIVR